MEKILSELLVHYGKFKKKITLNISPDDAKEYNKAVKYMFKNKSGEHYDVWKNNVVLFNIS